VGLNQVGCLCAAFFCSRQVHTASLPSLQHAHCTGVIVNAVLPSWLLALGVVAFLAISNAELLISIISMVTAKREILKLAAEIKVEAQAVALAASGDTALLGADSSTDAEAEGAWSGGGEQGINGSTAGDAAGGAPAIISQQGKLDRLRARARKLHARATRIEAVALLFPAFHFPTHYEISRLAKVDVDTIFGEGHGLDREPQFFGSEERETPSDERALPGSRLISPSGKEGAVGFEIRDWTGIIGGGSPVPLPPLPAGKWAGFRRWCDMQPKFEWLLMITIIVLHLATGRSAFTLGE